MLGDFGAAHGRPMEARSLVTQEQILVVIRERHNTTKARSSQL